jgi:hypothetical protein
MAAGVFYCPDTISYSNSLSPIRKLKTTHIKKPRSKGRLKQLGKSFRRAARYAKQSEFVTNAIRVDQLAYVSEDQTYGILSLLKTTEE